MGNTSFILASIGVFLVVILLLVIILLVAKKYLNAEMRRIVLQKNQHDRGQGDHPQKLVAVTRSGGNVGCPVSRVDKTDRDKKSRAEIAEKIHARRLFSFSILFHILSFLTI